jgi:hypothetical protein
MILHRHAHRRNLVMPDPDTRVTLDALGDNAPLGQNIQRDLLQSPQVIMQVVIRQFQDWVSNQLTWAVIGHAATTLG